MKRKQFIAGAIAGVMLVAITVAPILAQRGKDRDPVWAGCEMFKTFGTPAEFEPGAGPFDNLYQGAFKDGVGAISESAPGLSGYNGGRWHVFQLKSDVPSDKYADACSVDDLDLNDFEGTDTYFECPLTRGHGGR